MKIIRAINYGIIITEVDERDRIRYLLTCSNGLTFSVQQTLRNIRKIVAESNVKQTNFMHLKQWNFYLRKVCKKTENCKADEIAIKIKNIFLKKKIKNLINIWKLVILIIMFWNNWTSKCFLDNRSFERTSDWMNFINNKNLFFLQKIWFYSEVACYQPLIILIPEIFGNTNVHFVWFCCSMPQMINLINPSIHITWTE